MAPETGPGALKQLEDMLSALVPAAGGLKRDELMFEAGRRSGRSELPQRSSPRVWQIASLVLAAFSAWSAVELGRRTVVTEMAVHPGAVEQDTHPQQAADMPRAARSDDRELPAPRRRSTSWQTAMAAWPSAREFDDASYFGLMQQALNDDFDAPRVRGK
jgi:hypothetical protein